MAVISLSDWRAFVLAHPNLHLLQTPEWGELKSAFGWRAVRVVHGKSGAQILFRRLPFGMSAAYIPKMLADDGPASIEGPFWEEIDAVCARERAVFCKVELDAWTEALPQAGPRPAPDTMARNIQPPRTIILDLRSSEAEILERMKQKTRYNIRLAEKKGVSVRNWQDLPAFHAMLKITGSRDGFGVHSLEYYRRAYELFHAGGLCELLVAEFEGRPLAALMVFATGRRSWYVYGASTDAERNRMPTYLLQWEAMRWAKQRGAETYDLWGVPDEDESTLEAHFETRRSGLWGVYRFKRGFGGELKRAAQAVDRIYKPWLYKLYLWRTRGLEAD